MPSRDEHGFTWQKTRDIYLAAFEGLPVWCTNYLPGIRKVGSAVGNIRNKIEPNEWKAFEPDCWQFLQSQVLLQQPKLLVVFGKDNRVDLAHDDRLGKMDSPTLRHTFKKENERHSVLIVFADHPNYLKRYLIQAKARAEAERFRDLYQKEVGSNERR